MAQYQVDGITAKFQSSPTVEGGRDSSRAASSWGTNRFQSSPTVEGGRDGHAGTPGGLGGQLFQSSPTVEGGRDHGAPEAHGRHALVSILAHR